jgi:hypothetical protein
MKPAGNASHNMQCDSFSQNCCSECILNLKHVPEEKLILNFDATCMHAAYIHENMEAWEKVTSSGKKTYDPYVPYELKT